MLPTKPEKNQIYRINFEEYLQPKKPFKTRKLLFHDEFNNKHSLNKTKIEQKWRQFKERLTISLQILKENLKFKKQLEKLDTDDSRPFKSNILQKCSFKLPNFLVFLRARNDDGVCKRKSGFEIYCEMASIHGFYNFVGATTWQRALWFSVIFLAILFATVVFIMLYLINIAMPFIISTESTTHGAWAIPFPAVTLCTQNQISELEARSLAMLLSKNSNVTVMYIMQTLRSVFYMYEGIQIKSDELKILDHLLKENNLTFTQLSENLSPSCQSELVGCRWRGRMDKCEKLFEVVRTPFGLCCSFNLALQNNRHTKHTISAGYKSGLTVLIAYNRSDYMAGIIKASGYKMLIHDASDLPGIGGEIFFVRPDTNTFVSITPQQTYTTKYVSAENLHNRRCFLPKEPRLEKFANYSLGNCLAECYIKIFFELCSCVPLRMQMKLTKWSPCNTTQVACLLKNSAVFGEIVSVNQHKTISYRTNRYAEDFICKCYPSCSFNQYSSVLDIGVLDRTYSAEIELFTHGFPIVLLSQEELHKVLKIPNPDVAYCFVCQNMINCKAVPFKNPIFLHIYYADLAVHKLRMDVFENWLSFIGTFGGITGLFMGCSFVSVCELIFFVFVRPACNWLTKQQIRYRINQRVKQAAAEKVTRLADQTKK